MTGRYGHIDGENNANTLKYVPNLNRRTSAFVAAGIEAALSPLDPSRIKTTIIHVVAKVRRYKLGQARLLLVLVNMALIHPPDTRPTKVPLHSTWTGRRPAVA